MNKKLFNNAWPDLFIVIVLWTAGSKYVHGLERILDVRLYDESNYLWGGLTLFNDISVAGTVAEKTHLYSFWYYLLSLAEPDRISLYYFNYKVLTVLLPITLYLVLRRYKVNILISTIISFFFLISVANLGVWPKVGHFASIIVFSSFILASFAKSQSMRFAIISMSALLSAYARPEFFIVFSFFFFLFIYSIFIEFKTHPRRIFAILTGGLLITGLLILQLGLPVAGTRSFGAFAQHFSLNWIRWTNNQDLSNWTDWEFIINKNFGDSHSLTEAFFINPQIFMKHILSNSIQFPESLLKQIFIHANIILPATSKNLEAIMLLGLFLLSVFLFKTRSRIPFTNRIKANKEILLYSSAYLIVSMISILIIYPRDHYLLLPGILITVMITTLFAQEDTPSVSLDYKIVLLVGIIMIFITPSFTSLIGSAGTKTNVETISFIESLNIKDEVFLLEANGGFHIYLGNNFHRVASHDKNSNFNDFMEMRNINAVIVTNGMLNDFRYREDREWAFFLNNYQSLGFEKFDIPDTNMQLIIENNLINR
jgi:hypothetical protein